MKCPVTHQKSNIYFFVKVDMSMINWNKDSIYIRSFITFSLTKIENVTWKTVYLYCPCSGWTHFRLSQGTLLSKHCSDKFNTQPIMLPLWDPLTILSATHQMAHTRRNSELTWLIIKMHRPLLLTLFRWSLNWLQNGWELSCLYLM